jgi:hypothetical protein
MNDSGLEIRERLVRRIYAEYMEMPGLRLTQPQAQRFWGIDKETCVSLLNFLVEVRFLHRIGVGIFARLTDGVTSLPALRMANGRLDQDRAAPKKSEAPSAA